MAELIRLTLQAGAVHEICEMKSRDERGAAWRRGFVESLIGSYLVTFSGECQSFNSASSCSGQFDCRPTCISWLKVYAIFLH
jgi:hypothetical protein